MPINYEKLATNTLIKIFGIKPCHAEKVVRDLKIEGYFVSPKNVFTPLKDIPEL